MKVFNIGSPQFNEDFGKMYERITERNGAPTMVQEEFDANEIYFSAPEGDGIKFILNPETGTITTMYWGQQEDDEDTNQWWYFEDAIKHVLAKHVIDKASGGKRKANRKTRRNRRTRRNTRRNSRSRRAYEK